MLNKLIIDLQNYYQRNDKVIFDNKFKIAIINYFINNINNYSSDENLFYAARNAIDNNLINNQ